MEQLGDNFEELGNYMLLNIFFKKSEIFEEEKNIMAGETTTAPPHGMCLFLVVWMNNVSVSDQSRLSNIFVDV